jgi:endonuclease/exonuclease/phosphatase (EEP) superfamily protein YafD
VTAALLAVLRFLAGALALGAASLAILAFLGFAVPFLDLINHLQLLIFPAVLVGLVATALLKPGRWRSFVVAFTATGFIASSTAFIPDVVWSLAPRAPMPTDSRPVMKLMTHNIFGLNYEMARTARIIFEEDPDIIALQEYFPEQREELPALLAERYPHSAYCVGGKRANIALYSKMPFELQESGACSEEATADQRTSQILAKFIQEDGTTFSVLTTHLDWPFPIARQQMQIADLVAEVNAVRGPLIVVGDMNSTSWSYAMRGFAAATGLARQDFNMITYPLKFTLPMLTDDPYGLFPLIPFLPLDHVFTRGGVEVHEIHLAADTNSDHLPVVVTFSVEPMTECCRPD